MTGTTAPLQGDLTKETGKFSKYSYSTDTKQYVAYAFEPMVEPAFARALDAEVRKVIGGTPGHYNVKTDKPVKRSHSYTLVAYLKIKRPGEQSAQRIPVLGWCYEGGTNMIAATPSLWERTIRRAAMHRRLTIPRVYADAANQDNGR